MMEERRIRKEELQRRNSAEQKINKNNDSQRKTAINQDEIYICYGQYCRPITAYDILQFQLLNPTTKFYQQRTEPGNYFNQYSFRRT